MASRSTEFNIEALGADRRALAERIAQAASESGQSDAQLAERVGLTLDTWLGYKSGVLRVGVIRVPRIADALGVPVPWLLYGSGTTAAAKARRAGTLIVELADAVARLVGITRDLERTDLRIPHGEAMAADLTEVVALIDARDAVSPKPDVE